MKHTFKNGTTIEGTLEQIQKVAELFGEQLGPTYFSKSTGVNLLISEMNTKYIINALVKTARDFYILDNFKGLTLEEFLTKFISLVNESDIENLFVELQERFKKGEV